MRVAERVTELDAEGLIARLRELGVVLSAEGEDVRCSAPPGVLTPPLIERIRELKAPLLRVLRTEGPARSGSGSAAVLSFAQERMWLQEMLHPHAGAYNLPLRVDLEGPVAPEPLRLALAAVAARHEVLRTRYGAVAGRPVPIVDQHPAIPLRLVALAALRADARERALEDLAVAEANRPFDLAREAPLRAALVRTDEVRHSLLITRHHIAADGWSLGVLLGELSQIYTALRAGRPHGLPPLALQYSDYARWQRDRDRGQRANERLERWANRLRGADFGLGLLTPPPSDARPRRAGAVSGELPPALVELLRAFARARGTTLFTVLVAAYATTLHRLGGQRDLVIGTPTAGRTHSALEPLIGAFASVLPLRLDLTGFPTLEELVDRSAAVAQAALDDQATPTERLIERLRPPRLLWDNPLFASVLVLQNTPRPRIALQDLTATVPPSPRVAPKFALALTISERDGAMESEVEYDRDRLGPRLAERILESVRAVLEELLASPDAPVAERVPRIPGPQVRGAPFPGVASCVHTRVLEVAKQRPDAIALSQDGAQVTYRALVRRSGWAGARLALRGVGPEQLVGLCLDPSPELAISALGILRSGAGYLPMDPADPPRRRAQVCADAGVALVVTRRGLDRPAEIEHVDYEDLQPAPQPTGSAAPASMCAAVPSNIAYVVYTSGSTGAPKGVVVSHASITSLLAGTSAALPPLGEPRTWSMTHSPAFDVSVFEIWGALTGGGRLVIPSARLTRIPDELRDYLAAERVDVLSQTPSAFGQLAPMYLRSRGAGGPELVLLAGEAFSPTRHRAWFDLPESSRPALVNLFGATETTVHAMVRVVDAADAERPVSPLGGPIPGQAAVLLGEDGAPVPAGGSGVIYVGGIGVARGYLGRAGLTASRFVPVRGAPAGTRWYRTGDLGRQAESELEYLGREDEQVKIRGFRVEPGEIEAALAAHPLVGSAVVVARSASDRVYLVAYVVPADPSGSPRELGRRLRAHLAVTLPRHLVPAQLTVLDAFPLTRNGKVDKAALAALAPDSGSHNPAALPSAEADPAMAGPRTETERRLTGLVAALLERDPRSIGRRDNLFDLGGDSLAVTQLHARIVDAFRVDPPVRRVYQSLDIESLATTVDDLVATARNEAMLAALAELEAESEAGEQ